jgi:hypothetical protein
VSVASRSSSILSRHRPLPGFVVIALLGAALAPLTMLGVARGVDLAPATHLVVSEVVTGGASASDELIELHNPTTSPLPLEGLEVIYVTSSGATISRRAAWEVGAPSVPAGGHVLIANASGIYASIADATFESGMAATGGSVAIRILGASTAVDAAGWGTTTSPWREESPATAPSAGASIERLPGGALGSGIDTDDNAADFAERLVPGPENLGSPPTPDPAATPVPTATPGPPVVTPQPTATPDPPPTTTVTPIVEARAAPDETTVTIEAVALTASDFHDGGGFVADATGGIAVLLADGRFGPGELLRITGEIDDRFSQRTLRADSDSAVKLGTAGEPAPIVSTTGFVRENLEGRLVRTSGTVLGSPTTLTSGLAYDVDDGSGAIRVVVGTSTGIGTTTWHSGATVELVGVAGQRDSSGSGTEGYRLFPRDPGDVLGVVAPGASPTPELPPGTGGVTPISEARAAAENTQLRIRGVVTLPPGLLDESTAVLQDASGAILLRLGEGGSRVRLDARIEVVGTRSTLSGMESLRVTESITLLGTGSEPATRSIRTGDASETDEAKLVQARGAIVASARSSSTGTVYFDIDDGSGPLQVTLSASLQADRGPLVAGTWVEVLGVLGQETSRSEPEEGYRIWPRAASEVRVTAPATPGGGGSADSGDGGSGGHAGGPTGSLDDLGNTDLSRLRIGATLVVGPWKEMRVGGLLWDGTRLVAVHPSSTLLVARLTREQRPPFALDLGGLQAVGSEPVTGIPVVRLGDAAGQTTILRDAPAPPRAELSGDLPAWISVVGRLAGPPPRRVLVVDGEQVVVHDRCQDDDDRERGGTVAVTGVAIGEPLRLLVPCGGIRRAPSVAAGAMRTAVRDAPNASGPRLDSTADHVTSNVRRSIVAGLLLLAAVVIVGGAAAGRRRSPADEGTVGAAEDADRTEAAPHLTLLRVPPESGP